jgi:hypothetical protein
MAFGVINSFSNTRPKALVHSHSATVGHLERHKSIKLSTHGIVFMGTPHQGADITLGKLILNIASAVMDTNTNLPRNLEKNGEWLEGLTASYRPISRDFDTVYCYETKPMGPFKNFQKPVSFYFVSVYMICVNIPKVVPFHSAVVPGTVDTLRIGIQQNHIQMVKFASQNSDYKKVARNVNRMVGDGTEKVAANWAKWDQWKSEYANIASYCF